MYNFNILQHSKLNSKGRKLKMFSQLFFFNFGDLSFLQILLRNSGIFVGISVQSLHMYIC